VKPHPRTRSTVKWGGAVVATLLAALIGVSRWWWVDLELGRYTLGLSDGQILVFSFENSWRWDVRVGRVNLPYHADWKHAGRFPARVGATGGYAPAWILPACLLVPTVLAWYLDIRAKRRALGVGRCRKCRYDLRGLPAGSRCPECGAKSGGASPAAAR